LFARDKQSYDYVRAITPYPDRVFNAPDITLFYDSENKLKEEGRGSLKYCCIIPNTRMLDQGEEDWGKSYVALLKASAQRVIRSGLIVYVLLHTDEEGDLAIASEVVNDLPKGKVKLVEEKDALKIKDIIGNSEFVIGSRYHSLVAAFSKGVPSVCMGWSHKYDMLYRDFGVGEFVISKADKGDIEKKIDFLLEKKNNSMYREKIKSVLTKMKSKNGKMWDLVVEYLVKK